MKSEYVGQIHRHCSICSQHSVLSFFSPCTVFCPLFPVQSLPCAQLALLGDKSGLTAMNTDSLLMCYNLFWFAAQHSPSASSHSNANDDDDDGEAGDEDDKSEDVATIEIVNPIGIEYPQSSIMTTDTLFITQIGEGGGGVVWPHEQFTLLIFHEISSLPALFWGPKIFHIRGEVDCIWYRPVLTKFELI